MGVVVGKEMVLLQSVMVTGGGNVTCHVTDVTEIEETGREESHGSIHHMH